ncbi:hypothetical protein REPUB_Repub15cG0012700 [Reevesia pubescens]
MADIAREMEDFKAANRTFGGEWKLEIKGNNNNNSSSLNQQSSDSSIVPDPLSQPVYLPTQSTCKDIDKYSKNYYNYNNSNVKRGGGHAQLKMQRRVVKYNSYTVENKLKSSLTNGFRWMKNKYSELFHGDCK